MHPLYALFLAGRVALLGVFVFLVLASTVPDPWAWLVPVGLAVGGVVALFSGGLAHREAKRMRDAAAATKDPEDDKRVALAADALDELGDVLETLSGHPAVAPGDASDRVARAQTLVREARGHLTPLGEMKPGGAR